MPVSNRLLARRLSTLTCRSDCIKRVIRVESLSPNTSKSTQPIKMSNQVQKVVIAIAMEAEAQPIINKLNLTKITPSKLPGPAPTVVYTGKVNNMDIAVVHNGKCKDTFVDNVGTVPAALSTYLALEYFKPDLLINAGTAGGFKAQGAEIGDVYLSTSCLNHDRRIPLAQFEAYGIGKKESLSADKLTEYLNAKKGVVTTGNSFDYTSTCMEIMQKHMASVKDMEAAAVAWTADLFGVPMFCLKAVTDIVDGEDASAEQFIANLRIAAEALEAKVVSTLEFLHGKSLADL